MGGADLSPEHHAVVELILAKGQTHEQIAETLGVPRERIERLAREAAAELGFGEGSQAREVRDEASGEAERRAEEAREEHREANRRTAPMFAVYLLLIVAGIGTAIAIGIARESDDAAAGATVERFAAAIDAEDGAAACAQLTPDAQTALQAQEQKPCEEAILSLKLSGGDVVLVDVADTSAAVDLSEGDRAYLDQTPEGWRISAAGCTPLPSQPYDCELES